MSIDMMSIPVLPAEVRRTGIDDERCRVFRHATELAGRKWNGGILLALATGAQRFSEIRAAVAGISDRLLAARLRELEENGLVERTVTPTTPIRVDYALTPAGLELIGILHPLVAWWERWGDRGAAG